MHVRVGVGDRDELVARLAEADVQPVGLAAIDRVADHPAARVACACLERGGLGGVGRAVVEDEHLELRVVDGERGRDAGRDHRLLVVGGDQHGHAGPASVGLLGGIPLVQQAEERVLRRPTAPRCTPGRARRRPAAAQPLSTYRFSCRTRARSEQLRGRPARRRRSRRSRPARPRSPRCTRRTTRRRRGRRARGAGRARCRRSRARARRRVERLEVHRRGCGVLAHGCAPILSGCPAGSASGCPPGVSPDHPASRAANAAIPAAPQCQEGSARSRRRVPVRLSYQNAPSRSRRASARRPASAERAAARFAVASMPARARSSSTQPIPAAPLSSPTWRGSAGSPGSSSQAPPRTATRLSQLPARRASAR